VCVLLVAFRMVGRVTPRHGRPSSVDGHRRVNARTSAAPAE
jgi:hypothetical protein